MKWLALFICKFIKVRAGDMRNMDPGAVNAIKLYSFASRHSWAAWFIDRLRFSIGG